MSIKIETIILDKYLDAVIKDKFHRFRSWDNCFTSFSENIMTESHSLQLGFYLASWGMYRGSSGLLQKNHLIHDGAIAILYKGEFEELRFKAGKDLIEFGEDKEGFEKKIKVLFNLKEELVDYYQTPKFNNKDNGYDITATDTLISKILLGTMGCVLAFDRYFIIGIKEKNLNCSKFNKSSISQLLQFAIESEAEIKEFQNKVFKELNVYYPVMKVLDMYFWQIGYDKEMENKEMQNNKLILPLVKHS